MHSLKAATIIGLSITAISCSPTDSTSPDAGRPEWANGTDWSGSVTMKTGTVISVTFHLETRPETWFGNSTVWTITPSPARIENKLTGAGGFSNGWGFGDIVFIQLVTRDAAMDAPAGCLEDERWSLSYTASLHIGADGNLTGDLLLSCTGPGPEIDSQTIVMRRVTAG